MSRLTDLLTRAQQMDPGFGDELSQEIASLLHRRRYGLVYENHQPESVRMPTRVVRRGDMVEVMPARGQVQEDHTKHEVISIKGKGDDRVAILRSVDTEEKSTVATSDLIVCEKTNRPMYPGLQNTGSVMRGGDLPHHSVITGENYHALQMLGHTHHGKVDMIYIDPPYNTGDKSWKFNDDYVNANDSFTHSKWLSMMEGRLTLAKGLLNPGCSVMIVSIDARERANLEMLL